MEDLTIPQELVAEAEELLSNNFNLKVPPAAEAARKNGYAQWSEVVVIEDAYREVVEKNGNTQTVFGMRTKVLPAGDTVNGGKSYGIFNRINYPILRKVEELTEPETKQKDMSMGAINRLKGIAVAAGLDIEAAGLSNDILSMLFPLQGTAEDMDGEKPLVGKRFMISVQDNSNRQYMGNNQQNVKAFADAGEDDA